MAPIFRKSLFYFGIFCFYSALSLAMTYPLIMDMKHSIFGIGHDNLGWISNNWVSQKIEQEDLDPHKVDYLNYPTGYDYTAKLVMYTNDVLNHLVLLVCPNPVAASNLFLLIKFALSSFCMFILIGYLINHRFIALMVGFFYAFSPYYSIMAKAYGGGFVSFLLPLVVWRFLVFNENPKVTNFLWFLVSYVVFFGENYYYSYFFSVVFLLSVITAYFLPIKFRWGFLANSLRDCLVRVKWLSFKNAILTTLLGSGIVWFSYVLYERLSPHITKRVFSLGEAVSRSVDPVFYLIPSVTNSFLGKYSLNFALSRLRVLEVYELTVYLGMIPLALIFGTLIAMLLPIRFSISLRIRAYFLFFCILSVFSIVLALGPNFGLSYIFFKIAPMFRFISRYHVVTIFSVLVLLSIAVELTLNLFKKRIWKILFLSFCAVGIFVEYGDFTILKILNLYERMPQVYKYLAKDKEHYPILELNNKDWPSQAHLMAYQTFHNKKIQGGQYQCFNENILDQDVQKKYRDMGFKYVVVITKWKPVTYPPLQLNTGDQGIPLQPFEAFGYLKLEKKFGDSLLYRFTEDKADSLIGGQHATFYFSEGFWGQPDFLKNGEIRWMSSKTAVVEIYIPKDAYLPGSKFNTRLKFMGRSFHIARRVSLFVNGVEQNSLMIDNPDEYSVDLKLKKGVNTLVFRTNEKLINIGKTLNNEDNRDVALQLGRFKLSPLLK